MIRGKENKKNIFPASDDNAKEISAKKDKFCDIKNEGEKEKKEDKKRYCDYKQEIADALIKKAVGYSYSEVVEEFSISENEGEKLIKKKITTKSNPPDIPAAKVLLDLFEKENSFDLKQLSDKQLKEEIDKITEFLKEHSEDDGS